MSPKIRRIVFSILGVIILLAVLVTTVAPALLRRQAPRSFPQTFGNLQLSGLQAQVDVYRDDYGVPQIYADNMHDLFFAQGYIHAQDRFWQMDFWRHVGSGRLSEMFGKAQLETDQFLRTLGWERIAKQEVAQLDSQTLAMLQAYADGVNAYLADHQGTDISLEYAVLKLLNSSYTPAPWEPLNTLTWAKAMAWDLRGNMGAEIERAILLKTLTPQQVDELFPPYPADHPVIVPGFQVSSAQQNTQPNIALASQLQPVWQAIGQQFSRLDGLLGAGGDGIGSNNWVISGDLTDTGMPLLANDPHLSQQMPSIWYEIGLHCNQKSAECPYEVTGFSFAGSPGVVIGHNDRIAWGFTNVGPDVIDLYIEKINPDNPNQYEVNGQWVDMDIIHDTLMEGTKNQTDLTIRLTRHGPIISDTFGALKDFAQTSGVDLPENYAISMRWTALEPTTTFQAIWDFNIAQNWDEFRAAAAKFTVPAQNLVYADVDGNIGYQMPGNIPIRKAGHDGRYPVPGWTDDYEWQGFIPFDEHPFAFNPPQGFIATANNAVVGPDYPYLLTTDWTYGYRAQRIVDMITNAPGPISMAYIQQIQGDNRSLNAETLVPVLLDIPLNDTKLESTRAILQGWDYQMSMDSAPAALFAVFWKHLLIDTFGDDLPEDYQPGGGSRWFEVMRNIIDQPGNIWWDDQSTPQLEIRDDIFHKAFAEAVKELQKTLGKDPAQWQWGDLHTLTFENQTLGKSGIGLIENLFNRGPFPTSGSTSIVNATGWDTSSDNYTVNWLPSMRMIVDLSDLSRSITMHTTGQSGHAGSPHYIDMADPWRTIQFHPMLWTLDQAKSGAEDVLHLTP